MYDIMAPANNTRVKIRYYSDSETVEIRSPFARDNRPYLQVYVPDIDWDGMKSAWVGTIPADRVKTLALALKLKWLASVKIESAPRPAPMPSPTRVEASFPFSWNVEVL